jgi:hypothetical protein
MLPVVVRGMRARALLSAGSLLLIAVALGSAVLAPIFQTASTNSYLVSRLNDEPNNLTGLSWTWNGEASGPAAKIEAAEEDADNRTDLPFSPALGKLQTLRFPAFTDGSGTGQAMMLTAPDVCAHLEIRGRCPSRPDEFLILAFDLDRNLLEIGDKVDLGAYGVKKIVGTYRIPDGEGDYWFDPQRMASIPRFDNPAGVSQPYRPAPLVTDLSAFDQVKIGWEVQVDRLLQAPPDTTLEDATRAAAFAAKEKDANVATDHGVLIGDSINDLPTVLRDVRDQQVTARASIAPAVLSLVLVALALLMRLLMAAADLRLPELALASLRGLGRRRMWLLGMSEPLGLIVVAIPLGLAFGLGLGLALIKLWLVPGLPLPLPWTALAALVLVVLATIAVAVTAVGLVLRASLSEQLTGVRRPKAASRVAIILQLVIVALAGAVLASKLSTSTPGRPDATDLILPVLLAVVGGLAATRITAWLAGVWTRARTGGALSGYVAARALSRRSEGTLVILPVAAAIAVSVFGFGVYDSASAWRASVAATTAPADQIWTSTLTMNQTVALTHKIDPDGRYLMAGTRLSTLGPTYVVLDTPRLDRVSRWSPQWTPGVDASEVTDRLTLPQAPPTTTGQNLALTVENDTKSDRLYLRMRLDVDADRPHFVFVGPFPRGTHTRSQPTPFCSRVCELDGITFGKAAALPEVLNGRVSVSSITVDGKERPDLLDADWVPTPGSTGESAIVSVSSGRDHLDVDLATGSVAAIPQLSAGGIPERMPVAQGVKATLGAFGGSAGEATSAAEFPARAVVRTGSTPFLGPQGVVVDYTALTDNRQIAWQQVPVYVLARSDTPPEMSRALRDNGIALTDTFAQVRYTLDQGAYALALRLYAVAALLVLLMALAGLAVSTAVQLPARRRDAASLRVVGVPRRSVMAAVLRELGIVLGGTAIAGLAAGSLAQYIVLRTVTLGVVDKVETPALVAAIDPVRLVLLAIAAAVVFAAVALISASLTVRGARGSTLRESAR